MFNLLERKEDKNLIFMTTNDQLEIDIIIALKRLYNALQNNLYDTELLPEETNYSDGLKYDRLEQIATVLQQRGLVTRDQELVSLSEPGREYINKIRATLTEIEELILIRLNDRKNDPNATETVLSWELKLSEYECKYAIKRLDFKQYIYESSSINQKNLGEISWRISDIGENEVQKLKKEKQNSKKESFGEKVKRLKSKYWIPVAIISGIIIFVGTICNPILTEIIKSKVIPKEPGETVKVKSIVHDTIYLDSLTVGKSQQKGKNYSK